jgi:hypothetical protein
LFDTIQDRADEVGETDRCRHVWIQCARNLTEVVEMTVGQGKRLQLVCRVQASVVGLVNELH